MNFKEEWKEKTQKIEQTVIAFLPQEEGFAENLIQAVNYSLKAGGKRIRPLLMHEAYLLFGGNEKGIEPFMAAIEMIHTHSLIHDDLPALDNDSYRRGRKTTHVVYGEAAAILAGDALLNYAYETALQSFEQIEDTNKAVRALQVLANKSGIYGMLGGQGVDVENDQKPLSKEMLDYIYVNKTSALIEASLLIGAILGGAQEEEISKMERVGRKIGLAFQIQDDILDVAGNMEELGKPIRSDEKNHKTTYVTLEGMDKAAKEVRNLTNQAVEELCQIKGEKEFLVQLLRALTDRRK